MEVRATGHHHRLDEKEVQYRKELSSSRTFSEHSGLSKSSKPISKSSRSHHHTLGKPKFQDTKRHFIGLIDQYNEAELGKFTFVVEFGKGGINVTHEDFSTYVNV